MLETRKKETDMKGRLLFMKSQAYVYVPCLFSLANCQVSDNKLLPGKVIINYELCSIVK